VEISRNIGDSVRGVRHAHRQEFVGEKARESKKEAVSYPFADNLHQCDAVPISHVIRGAITL
jgi:hypothetical protein